MKLADLTPDNLPALECAGTLAEWSAAANRLFAPGCEAQSFALLASFAAPLMSLLKTDEGGAVVSIWGGKKSGKSIAYEAALSVWGDDEGGIDISPLSGGARCLRLPSLGNLPALDESLASRDPEIVRAFLGNFVRKGAGWQTTLISFAPVGILWGHESRADVDGFPWGVEFQVKVPPALQVAHSRGRDPLAYDLIANRGNAGAAYLRHLVLPETLAWAKRALTMQMAEMRDAAGTVFGGDGPPRFAMRAIAACHVAGEITAKLGILEFEPDRITRWARAQAFPVAAR